MSDNLPPLPPCPDHAPVAISTPVLLRSALEGPPISNPSAVAGTIIDPDSMVIGDNELIVIANADGAAGNAISVTISAPAYAIVTSVQVVGTDITIIPAGRAIMYVTSAAGPFNGPYREAGNYPGTSRPMWVKINAGINPPRLYFPYVDSILDGEWVFDLSDGVPVYTSGVVTYDAGIQPESLSFFDYVGGAPSPLVITPMTSDSSQAAAAINLSPEASALVLASPQYGGYGQIEAAATKFLTGGVDGSPGTPAAGIAQFCRVGPYLITPPRTEAYDWFIAETLDSWRQVFI